MYIWRALRVAIFGASAIGLLAPPFFHSAGTLNQYILDLVEFQSPIYSGVPLLSWILIFFVMYVPTLLILKIRSYLNDNFIPVSVVKVHFIIEFPDGDLSDGVVKRNQIFHANRRGIKGYQFSIARTDERGHIPKDKVDVTAHVRGVRINRNEDGRPSFFVQDVGNGEVDVLVMYNDELPTNFFASIFPGWFVLFLYGMPKKFFKDVIVEQTATYHYENEFDGETAMTQVMSVHRPVEDITVEVRFPKNKDPGAENIRAFLIKEGSVKWRDPIRKQYENTVSYCVSRERSFNEYIRITWENRQKEEIYQG